MGGWGVRIGAAARRMRSEKWGKQWGPCRRPTAPGRRPGGARPAGRHLFAPTCHDDVELVDVIHRRHNLHLRGGGRGGWVGG